jgi:patatin-like phospholipase/acyl hydrolase
MQDAGVQSSKPSDWFDLIIGTGTGGILAVLLGVLQLPIRECIDIYKELSTVASLPSNVFAKTFRLLISGAKYDSSNFERKLKAEIKRLMQKRHFDDDIDNIRLSDFPPSREDRRPHVAVVGRRGNFDSSFCFINFNCAVSRDHKMDESLWKVLRATSAAPFFFEPVMIGKLQ